MGGLVTVREKLLNQTLREAGIGIPTPLPAPLPGGGPKGYQPASQSAANHPVTQPEAKTN
jgi:hypothetical protein